jgi:hypothetical protein
LEVVGLFDLFVGRPIFKPSNEGFLFILLDLILVQIDIHFPHSLLLGSSFFSIIFHLLHLASQQCLFS